jgi:hypothetical protein
MRRAVPTWLYVLAAAALGALTGYNDLHNEDVQAGVLAVAGSTFILTALRPGAAWAYVLIVGAAIPVAHVVASALDLELPHEASLPWTLLAFIPAAIGAVAARRLRKGMAKARP